MKLNPDCIRDVMITVENREFGQHMTLDLLSQMLPQYDINEIHYCCLKLEEAGFLELITVGVMGQTMQGIKTIKDLTFYGHEFLENIKSDNNWTKTKQIAKKVGSSSLQAIAQIATTIISNSISNNLM